MARALWLVDTLENAGLTVHPFKDWETRGQTTFTPTGVMWHHTVTRPTTADPTIDHFLAITGSSTVAAPLCNYSTNRDGSVSVIAAGTANHGGTGVWKGVSGNRYWFGDEMKNLGTSKEPWPQIQLDAARIAAAAILAHLEKPADWLVAHKEYATPAGRKSDPHTLNMTAERLLVAALLNPTEEATDMLPLKKGEKREDVRLLQLKLNKAYGVKLAMTGVYDDATVAAVKAHLTQYTGSPNLANGEIVVSTMWEGLDETLRVKAGAAVDPTARANAAAAHGRIDKLHTV